MTTTTTPTVAPQTTRSLTAYRILRVGFAVAPILFGLDKFTNLMTDWTQFLPEFVTNVISGGAVMAVVGVVEIIAGIGVWLRPKIFAYVVAAQATDGATLGKRAMRLRVVGPDGRPPGWKPPPSPTTQARSCRR